jgi:hypothetical protein
MMMKKIDKNKSELHADQSMQSSAFFEKKETEEVTLNEPVHSKLVVQHYYLLPYDEVQLAER